MKNKLARDVNISSVQYYIINTINNVLFESCPQPISLDPKVNF